MSPSNLSACRCLVIVVFIDLCPFLIRSAVERPYD